MRFITIVLLVILLSLFSISSTYAQDDNWEPPISSEIFPFEEYSYTEGTVTINGSYLGEKAISFIAGQAAGKLFDGSPIMEGIADSTASFIVDETMNSDWNYSVETWSNESTFDGTNTINRITQQQTIYTDNGYTTHGSYTQTQQWQAGQ